jgi:hypothetical protein
MRFALAALALGTLVSWVLAGAFSRLLAIGSASETIPLFQSTWQMMIVVITSPATVVALGVIFLGLAAWWWRSRLTWLTARLRGIAHVASADFGFEWLNHRIIMLTMRVAAALRKAQTGQLNWNVAGIVGGLLIVLSIIAW